ncbi:MAG TPA: hypothetical protein VLX28_10385 [Thermoanaerobaculia bacterium]|nr:hypothetical protein [Thermoanaerobaculia bacterium]
MILQYLDTIIAFSVVFLGLSLLITIFNQMISTLLSYRGTNLLWGVKTVLSTIDPALKDKAEEIAKAVLTQPMISDSLFSKYQDVPFLKFLKRMLDRWRMASAMSAEDLIHGLRQYAEGLRVQSPPQSPPDGTAMALNAALAAIDPEVARKAQMIESLVNQVAPNAVDKADEVLKQLSTSTQQAVGKVEVWFNRTMDRASQRFALQMRLWTIFFAIVLAFGVNINTFKILQNLWSSPATRDNLVNTGGAMLQEAEVVLSTTPSGTASTGPNVSPQIVNQAMANLRSQDKDAAALPAPDTFKSYNEAVAWLKQKAPESQQASLVNKYEILVLDDLKSQFTTVQKNISNSGFALIPSPYQPFWCDDWKGIAGVLVTAAFLSLGAPFWFNALKTLSNLRPMVATKQDANKPPAGS